jgi:hypothetical protein
MNRVYLPIQGVLLVIITALLGGWLSGIAMILLFRATRYLIAPAVVGGFVGVILLSIAIWQGRVRDVLLNSLFAVVMGIVIYGTFQADQYWDFRQSLANDIQSQLGDLDQGTVDTIIDEYLIDETGSTGFIGYVRHLLKYGVTVSRMGVFSRQTSTGETLLYVVIDILLVLGVLVLGTIMATRRAFCDHCKRYYGRMSISWTAGMEILGRVARKSATDFLNLIEANQYGQAHKLIERKQFLTSCLEIQIERCKTCDHTPITLTAMQTGGLLSNRRKVVYRQNISPQQYRQLASKS